MYPNQQPLTPPTQTPPQPQTTSEQPQFDAGYLDQIVTQPVKPTMKPWLLWSMIGGVVLIIIIAIAALASGGDSYTSRFQQFQWRLESVGKLANDSSGKIKSSELRALNSSLISIINGANREAIAFTVPEGKKPTAQPKNSPLLSEFATLGTTLEDAQLNVKFDEVYARQMAYQLATLQNEIAALSKTKKTDIRTFLTATNTNITPFAKQFSEFSDSQT